MKTAERDGCVRYMIAEDFAPIPRGPKGKWICDAGGARLCRFCGSPIPKDRGRMHTCGEACRRSITLATSVASQRYAVERRDKGICVICGMDTEKLRRVLWHRWSGWDSGRNVSPRCRHHVLETLRFPPSRTSLWDMDHIIRVEDGGGIRRGMTADEILANLRTLCIPCHVGLAGGSS